jgi:hypothetical protein
MEIYPRGNVEVFCERSQLDALFVRRHPMQINVCLPKIERTAFSQVLRQVRPVNALFLCVSIRRVLQKQDNRFYIFELSNS